MRNNAVAISLFLICISFPAEANWQYTQWEMAPAQVIAASQGSAHLVAGGSGDRLLGSDLGAEGTYSAQGFDFKTQFYFDNTGRLRVVKLTLMQQRCTDLQQSLRGIYGSSVESSPKNMVWHDTEKGNRVRLTNMPEVSINCFILYTPLGSSGAGGL
jgi:hypothetical protein